MHCPTPIRSLLQGAVYKFIIMNIKNLLIVSLLMALTSCRTYPVPEGAVVVKPFDKEKYLGTWYEIARFDFKFEKNLNNTTATYSLNEDGTIKVVNRGFNYVKGQWKESVGRAKFVDSMDEARLKVSFFGPFYGGYHVAALDADYQWALVVGPDRSYFWILSRTRQLPPALRGQLIARAEALGIDTRALIWVTHHRTDPQP